MAIVDKKEFGGEVKGDDNEVGFDLGAAFGISPEIERQVDKMDSAQVLDLLRKIQPTK